MATEDFLIRITRNDETGDIISLYSPDFGVDLLEYRDCVDVNNNYRNHIIDTLLDLVTKNKGRITPKTLKDLRFVPVNPSQSWEKFTIDANTANGCFARALPTIGNITNVFEVLSGGFITYMALSVASSNKDDADNANSSKALMVFGTLLSSIISALMYIYSDAGEMLTDIGANIDQNLKSSLSTGYLPLTEDEDNIQPPTSRARKAVTLLASLGITANMVVTSITIYQETMLLVDKYLALSPDMTESERNLKREILKWLVVNNFVLVGAYTGMAFQGSFAAKLADRLSTKFEQNPPGVFFRHESVRAPILEEQVNQDQVHGNSSRNTGTTPGLNPDF